VYEDKKTGQENTSTACKKRQPGRNEQTQVRRTHGSKELYKQPKERRNFAMIGKIIHDFRVGIQLADDKGRKEAGAFRYSNWMSERPRWSGWATDANRYDPDAVRLHLERKGWLRIESADFRFIIQAADGGGLTEFGIPRFTPWASEIGASAEPGSDEMVFNTDWSDFAYDSNQYDPDALRIALQWRRWPSNVTELELIDLRFGLQLVDNKGRSELGDARYTPWLGDGGGFSGWAMDENKYDFDGVRIGMEVRLKKVS
jgi:hypothetical protein